MAWVYLSLLRVDFVWLRALLQLSEANSSVAIRGILKHTTKTNSKPSTLKNDQVQGEKLVSTRLLQPLESLAHLPSMMHMNASVPTIVVELGCGQWIIFHSQYNNNLFSI
jgi:hypothetical protein